MSLSPLSRVFTPAEAAILAERIPGLPPEQRERAMEIVRELARQEARRKFDHLFPDETHEWMGETYFARDLYGPHMEFVGLGRDYIERCFRAANRVGKTVLGAYETACHLTGRYPNWWHGHRFDRPISAWAAGKSNETTRDIVQKELFGPVEGSKSSKHPSGTGVIPGDAIGSWTWRTGVSDLMDTIKIKHVSGRWSTLGLKSYEQGRGSFEGTAKHWAWLDEEPPLSVYGEVLIRLMTTGGRLALTYTPLEGMSETTIQFDEHEDLDRRYR